MNTGQRCIAAAALCFGPFATAQVTPDPLALRDSLIWDLYENESHGPLLRAVDQQVIEAKDIIAQLDRPMEDTEDGSRVIRLENVVAKELGVTEVLYGFPDKPEEEIPGYIAHLAGKLAALGL